MKKKKVNKNRVIIENNKVKLILSESTLQDDSLPIEEAEKLTLEYLSKYYDQVMNEKGKNIKKSNDSRKDIL